MSRSDAVPGQWTIGDFTPLIGQTFQIVRPAPAETLTLLEARTAAAAPPPGCRQAFSLLFEGSNRDCYLVQHGYLLENQTLGRFELFIVPLGPDARGHFRYEAVFC